MGKFVSRIATWFQGKKTILGGVVIMAAAVAGVWLGKVDAVTGLTIFGAGLSVLGGSAKANRHQAELLTALQGVAAAGVDLRAGKSGQAIQAAESTLQALAPGVLAEAVPVASSALHISGATADDVIRIANGLASTTHVYGPSSPTPFTPSAAAAAISKAMKTSPVNSGGSVL